MAFRDFYWVSRNGVATVTWLLNVSGLRQIYQHGALTSNSMNRGAVLIRDCNTFLLIWSMWWKKWSICLCFSSFPTIKKFPQLWTRMIPICSHLCRKILDVSSLLRSRCWDAERQRRQPSHNFGHEYRTCCVKNWGRTFHNMARSTSHSDVITDSAALPCYLVPHRNQSFIL